MTLREETLLRARCSQGVRFMSGQTVSQERRGVLALSLQDATAS